MLLYIKFTVFLSVKRPQILILIVIALKNDNVCPINLKISQDMYLFILFHNLKKKNTI